MVYAKVGFNLSQTQKEAIKQVYIEGRSVTLSLGPAQLSGKDFLGLTKVQQNKVSVSRRKEIGIVLNLSKTKFRNRADSLADSGIL